MTHSIAQALRFFFRFHQGVVNIVLHVLGFIVCGYSIWQLDLKVFIASLLILESGHIYNHVTGIQQYDLRPKVFFWRALIFGLLVCAFYFFKNIIF